MMKGEDKYGRNIVEQVVEPVNTLRRGKGEHCLNEVSFARPRSIYRQLDLRNSKFLEYLLHLGIYSHPTAFFVIYLLSGSISLSLHYSKRYPLFFAFQVFINCLCGIFARTHCQK